MTPESAAWRDLLAYSDTLTCYSAALAAWAALEDPMWPRLVNSGLDLKLVEAADGLFGFVHFQPTVRAATGLARSGADEAEEAEAGILAELEHRGRVIVAGDGFNVPWHVAARRRHVPHWFVLAGPPTAPVAVDPFSSLNDLGRQEPAVVPVDPRSLAEIALAHPADDDVVSLREAFALGDDARPVARRRFQWLAGGDASTLPAAGPAGPAAVRRLARHFHDEGDRDEAYRQADDVWSVGRHRAFLARYGAAHAGLADWVEGHVEPLARRWSHVAPLLMQARLAIAAGRPPTGSLEATLDELAAREEAAAEACPPEGAFLLGPA